MESPFIIFIVEDDPWYGQLLHYHLSLNPENTVHLWTSGQECLDNMHLLPDVVTIDFSLPDISGDKLLSTLRQRWPEVPLIVISAQRQDCDGRAAAQDGRVRLPGEGRQHQGSSLERRAEAARNQRPAPTREKPGKPAAGQVRFQQNHEGQQPGHQAHLRPDGEGRPNAGQRVHQPAKRARARSWWPRPFT